LHNVPLYKVGKVRDVYDLGDRLLIVASDRISAFDVVLGSKIPDKGKILTRMSLFWMDKTRNIIKNHIISGDIEDLPQELKKYGPLLKDRIMIAKKTEPFPIEAVVRGYLAGSGWREYRETGGICGIKLPEGLVEAEELPKPIFTPATKATEGHDINISEKNAGDLIERKNYDIIKEASLRIYHWAKDYALNRGIVIADTKFEFGKLDNEIILIDEMLTPDSSRFWPASKYEPGHSQDSFDKQYVRDYLESTGWDKKPPAPSLPDKIIRKTVEKYCEAYDLLTKKI